METCNSSTKDKPFRRQGIVTDIRGLQKKPRIARRQVCRLKFMLKEQKRYKEIELCNNNKTGNFMWRDVSIYQILKIYAPVIRLFSQRDHSSSLQLKSILTGKITKLFIGKS